MFFIGFVFISEAKLRGLARETKRESAPGNDFKAKAAKFERLKSSRTENLHFLQIIRGNYYKLQLILTRVLI
ncbi:MAG: hypothetical protein JWO44_55 [Bacteroidetes bacterium]|nr:hypothetical protein [Bacteroidota bacterium]